MIDSPDTEAMAADMIVFGGRTYELYRDGVQDPVYIPAIFQIVKPSTPNATAGMNLKERGHSGGALFKTDPNSPLQPAIGDEFEAFFQTWKIATNGRLKGAFRIWTCSQVVEPKP